MATLFQGLLGAVPHSLLPGAPWDDSAAGYPGWLFSQETQDGIQTPNFWLHSQGPKPLGYPASMMAYS